MLEVQKLNNCLGFRVSGYLLKQVHEWEFSQDEVVFKEQLKTGSFRGRYEVEGSMLYIQQQAELQGKIMPYYGAGGSSGACIYKFQLKGSKCQFQVTNSLTEETLDLEVDIKEVDPQMQMIRKTEIQFSFLPYFTDQELEHPWTGERNPTLVCKIARVEYETLTQWKHWKDDQALTPRYIYEFGQVSLGETGLTVKVEDTQTGEIIDATDYDSW